ncbi:NlpC/P60 family protein [Faunimonas pinastri]|uniref:NlpC/P60 family protein n=1 Tax=Faunimonas pinastri TaxID=1855383 RepID=A0A1H9HH62_9HYPH|nr:NlpC/P60 family protein [Faunimonas pinastri]SEQ61566.1 NlpC/P60 family protein [Faunimonas pinastri]
MTELDPRINAARPDLADIRLRHVYPAERYAEGEVLRVASATAAFRGRPAADATMLTEGLHGEAVRVFETTGEGWCWAQLEADSYVGWVARSDLAHARAEPEYRVTALRTPVFAGPDIKLAPLMALSLGARVHVGGEAEDHNARYGLLDPAGAVVMQHLGAAEAHESDPVAVAERFLGTPYLWGGRTSFGIDCSALVQVACEACGIAAPRDSDMQRNGLGEALDLSAGVPELKRGDLVFWRGHVGIMQDGERLLHANAFHMAVASEPLRDTLSRFEAKGLTLAAIRRLV